MKTQISRHNFDRRKRYSGLYHQQGRMFTDADWNELTDIIKHRLDTALLDVIGSGSPKTTPVTGQLPGGQISLHWGDVYIDGIKGRISHDGSGESETPLFEYDRQADFPRAPALPEGPYKLYVDLWDRAVTALEDPALRDPGLKGADTCTRTRTLAQVKWCPVDVDPEDPADNPPKGNARLTAKLRRDSVTENLCTEEDVRYRTGNYLFRLEVHSIEPVDPDTERITLKWSSENGAEAYKAGQEPHGFIGDGWAFEFFSGPDDDFASEIHLGNHFQTNTDFPSKGILLHTYPQILPEDRPFVRRWDGFCVIDRDKTGAAALVSDPDGEILALDRGVPLSTETAAESHGHVSPGTTLKINTLALELKLSLYEKDLIPGDFWYALVRESRDETGDTLIHHALPTGIDHHYMTLAVFDGTGLVAPESAACRPHGFPRLTDLNADDVCFDNTGCPHPLGRSVQDAIERLHQERHLPHHNRHLHGWGIVCGLQVECGPDSSGPADESPRRLIRVKHGYAVDSHGNDIIVSEDAVIDLIEQAEKQELLDETGNGSVCISVALDHQGIPGYQYQSHQPPKTQQEKWAAFLDNTLIKDFYDNCIKKLRDELEKELTPTAGENKEMRVGPVKQRLISLANLIIQLTDPRNGSFVFLSHREHHILEKFYLRLVALLKSHTFCAMYEDNDFPEYPFSRSWPTTIFGKGFHTRIKFHPHGTRLFSCNGKDNKIYVYDIEKQVMLQEIEMPAAKGAQIQDIAFSPKGDILYAAALLKGVDTVFGMADLNGDTVKWQDMTMVCDIHLTVLVPSEKDDNRIYALGKGDGLFFLNIKDIMMETKSRPDPKYAFHAAGHLAVDEKSGWAYVTLNSEPWEGPNSDTPPPQPDAYDQVAALNIASPPGEDNQPPPQPYTLRNPETEGRLTGQDGIALQIDPGADTRRVYVISDPVADAGGKHLIALDHDRDSEKLKEMFTREVEDSHISMAYTEQQQWLLLTFEDSHRMQIVEGDTGETVVPRFPVQIAPVAVAVHPETGMTCVLNFLSTTITCIPERDLKIDPQFPADLKEYRDDIIAAFLGLASGLLQYLKDAFCDLLLLKCPDPEDEETIFLACAEVRARKVYKICNFSKRKYVKSFPAMDYWMSAVPVLPFIRKGVEMVCCSVLPALFENRLSAYNDAAPDVELKPAGTVKNLHVRKSIHGFKTLDLKKQAAAGKNITGLFGKLTGDSILKWIESPPAKSDETKMDAVAGSGIEEAAKGIKDAGADVHAVKPYVPRPGTATLKAFATAPYKIHLGDKVTLYQENGKVVYYTVDRETPAMKEMEKVKEAEAKALENVKKLQKDLAAIQQEHSRLKIEIAKDRPVKDVSGVSKTVDSHLREMGIRTVHELALADADTLAGDGSPVDRARALHLIANANTKLTGLTNR